MTKFITSTAVATILSASAAIAGGHMSTSMTCEEYNQLSGADRDKVAVMAVMELNDDAVPTAGTATATDDSVGTAAEESTSAASQGSATATSIAGAGDDMTRLAEEIGVLNRTCSRNWDAKVIEAAAGSEGTR